MTQPKALYLADMLMDAGKPADIAEAAAAELRRLHELAMDQQGKIYALEMARSMAQKTAKIKHDALLGVLKQVEPILARMYGAQAAELPPMKAVRAAIKAAEENT